MAIQLVVTCKIPMMTRERDSDLEFCFQSSQSSVLEKSNFSGGLKVSVKENEVLTEKNSSRASIFAAKASYISN